MIPDAVPIKTTKSRRELNLDGCFRKGKDAFSFFIRRKRQIGHRFDGILLI